MNVARSWRMLGSVVRRTVRRSVRDAAYVTLITGLVVIVAVIVDCASTLVFRLLYADTGIRDASRIVELATTNVAGRPTRDFHYEVYQRLRSSATEFDNMSAQAFRQVLVGSDANARTVTASIISPDFAQTLGVQPALGSVCQRDERGATAVLDHLFWLREYNGAEDVLGREITVEGRPFKISGVWPASFRGVDLDTRPAITLCVGALASLFPEIRGDYAALPFDFNIIGRLKPGVTASLARTRAEALLKALVIEKLDMAGAVSEQDRRRELNFAFQLVPLAHGTSANRDRFASWLPLLASVASVIIGSALASVGSLLFSRGVQRVEEARTALALGASIRLLALERVIESFPLTAPGIMLGGALTWLVVPLLGTLFPSTNEEFWIALRPDIRVLAVASAFVWALLVAALVTPVFGTERLIAGQLSRRMRQPRLWRAIVAVELGVATVALVGTFVLVRSYRALVKTSAGFGSQTVEIELRARGLGVEPERIDAEIERIESALRAIPGVLNVGYSTTPLIRGKMTKAPIEPAGTYSAAGKLNTSVVIASPEYVEAIGIKLLRGSGFGTATNVKHPIPVLVNRTFARTYFDENQAVGKRLGKGIPQRVVDPDFEVVGVTEDFRYRSLREDYLPVVFLPATTLPMTLPAYVYVRFSREPQASDVSAAWSAARSIARATTIAGAAALRSRIEGGLWQERLCEVAGIFASLLTCVICAFGVNSLVRSLIAGRLVDLGVMMAVGASPANVQAVVFRWLVVPLTCGLLVGIVGYSVVGRTLKMVLYRTTMWDAPSVIGATALILLLIATSLFSPIKGLMGIEPSEALRKARL